MADLDHIDFADSRVRDSDRAPLMLVLKSLHEGQQELRKGQEAMDAKLTKHMTEETHELAEAISKLMKDAFPEGDPGGHRAHHEAVIRAAESRAATWHAVRVEVAKYGVIGIGIWIATLVWQNIVQGIHK